MKFKSAVYDSHGNIINGDDDKILYMWAASVDYIITTPLRSLWIEKKVGGTISRPSKSATNLLSILNRGLFSASGVGKSAGITTTKGICVRGAVAKVGGFSALMRFGVETLNGTGQQIVVGLSSTNADLSVEPSAIPNLIAITKDTTETKWQLCFRNDSALTKIPINENIVAGKVYDLTIFCQANSSKITVSLVCVNDDRVLINAVDYTTNLPNATTFLYAMAQLRSTAVGDNGLAVHKIVIETDY